MARVAITVLGRAIVTEEFVELWNGTADVGNGTVTVAPVVPAATAGQEFIVSVLPSGISVNFGMFVQTAREPQVEAEQDAAAPADPSLMGCSAVYGAFAGQARRAPFRGGVVALCAVGRPQPSL